MPTSRNHVPLGTRSYHTGKENLDGAVHHYDKRPAPPSIAAAILTDPGPARPMEMTEQPVLYRVLARVDGGPWSTEFVATSPAAATFPTPKQAEGVITWFRAQRLEGVKVEYTLVPIVALKRDVA